MSKKMKMKGVVVAGNSSLYEDARSNWKHESLLQDYQELFQETDALKKKLLCVEQRKFTLLAEVRFLQQRYKYLLENPRPKPQLEQGIVQQKILKSQVRRSSKKKAALPSPVPMFDLNQNKRFYSEKEHMIPLPSRLLESKEERAHSGKETTLMRNKPLIANLSQKGRILNGKEAAVRMPVSMFDLNHNEWFQNGRIHSGRDAVVRIPVPMFDLNHNDWFQNGRVYNGKDAILGTSVPMFDLNHNERFQSGNEWAMEKFVPVVDQCEKEGTCNEKEGVLQNRVPIFDLNQISREDEELQANWEPLRREEPKKILLSGNDEQHNDMKLSACRSVGSGPNRPGKRKISWQDQVALRV
ncbi:hypothetical protein RJ641_025446 [Dillenia turbinata]|uniref:Uncharacterized protein n=1 Tax=Dillenia turbinata TaxID=194707 RepID=A0AAN8W6X4_9MAGN